MLDFCNAAVEALGAPSSTATVVAEHLVGANLAGHDSHGVQRLPGYADAVATGTIRPAAEPELLRATGSISIWDAKSSFGHYSTLLACQSAANIARSEGVGLSLVRHSTHIGRVGHYAERLAGRGLVSLITVGMAGDGVGAMVLPGTNRRFFGANPWTFGIPSDTSADVIVDISTAVVAEGKVQVALAEHRQMPPDIIVDSEGAPTTDPDDYFKGGALLPLGGALAGHKGYGLGLASALLGAMGCVGDDEPTLAGAPVSDDGDPRGRIAGVFVVVIDPALVTGVPGGYQELVSAAVESVHRAGPNTLVPGEPEHGSRLERSESFLLPSATLQALDDLGARLGVPL